MRGDCFSAVLTEICMVAFGVVNFIVHLFLFIFVGIPIILYRFMVRKTSKLINPKLGRMITARGQFVAASENFADPTKSPRSNIVFCMIVKGRLDISRVREAVNLKLLKARNPNNGNKRKYPELKQYVTTWPSWLGFKYWKHDENFDIEFHVQSHQPYSHFNDDDLKHWIETLVNEPFEDRKSPWNIFLTNNYVDPNISTDEMTLFTVKAHHCLSDGYGWVYALVDGLGSGMPAVPKPNASRTSWQALVAPLTFPLRFIYELSTFAKLSFQNYPFKAPDERKAWRQLYCKSPIIPVQKIKGIKSKFGVSFSSVLQSACAAAIRQNLLKREPQENSGFAGDRNKLVDIGAIPTAIVLPLPNHPKKLRNHSTGIYINLPTECSDSVVRLKKCEMQLQRARNSPQPFLGKLLPVVSGSLTSGLASIFGKNRQFSLCISNLPVSISQQYYLMEKEVLHVTCGAGALVGVSGIFFLICSYNKGMQFSLTAEASVLSQDDAENLMKSAVEEVETLYRWSTTV